MRTSHTDLWQLSSRLRRLVEEELNHGEKISWIGTPNPRRFALRSIPIVIFAIPWTGFSVFWIVGASQFSMPPGEGGGLSLVFGLFPLFGLPFVLIGLAMMSAPFWMLRKAKRTLYVVTSSRAILFDGGFSTAIRSFGPDQLGDLRRKQRWDGSGDLIFERKLSYDGEGHRCTTDVGFRAISDVKRVEDLVRQLVDMSADHRT